MDPSGRRGGAPPEHSRPRPRPAHKQEGFCSVIILPPLARARPCARSRTDWTREGGAGPALPDTYTHTWEEANTHRPQGGRAGGRPAEPVKGAGTGGSTGSHARAAARSNRIRTAGWRCCCCCGYCCCCCCWVLAPPRAGVAAPPPQQRGTVRPAASRPCPSNGRLPRDAGPHRLGGKPALLSSLTGSTARPHISLSLCVPGPGHVKRGAAARTRSPRLCSSCCVMSSAALLQVPLSTVKLSLQQEEQRLQELHAAQVDARSPAPPPAAEAAVGGGIGPSAEQQLEEATRLLGRQRQRYLQSLALYEAVRELCNGSGNGARCPEDKQVQLLRERLARAEVAQRMALPTSESCKDEERWVLGVPACAVLPPQQQPLAPAADVRALIPRVEQRLSTKVAQLERAAHTALYSPTAEAEAAVGQEEERRCSNGSSARALAGALAQERALLAGEERAAADAFAAYSGALAELANKLWSLVRRLRFDRQPQADAAAATWLGANLPASALPCGALPESGLLFVRVCVCLLAFWSHVLCG
eukprot:scaffold459_cov391-Prasinococcus_capsulatus_cf.AAC.3